jgi:hypothetical protein
MRFKRRTIKFKNQTNKFKSQIMKTILFEVW